MSRQDEQGAAVRGLSLRPAPPALELSPALLLAALTRLASADTLAEVAAAVPALLVHEPGVRACAVVGRDGAQVVVLGSAGYDCGTMDPGATLPLDAGLPVTEAVRSSRTVARGTGPAWVGVPFGGVPARGALLLSLLVAPPTRVHDLAALPALARAVGDALQRAQAQESAFLELALVTVTLAQPASPSGPGVSVRQRPVDGVVGADVALRVDARDATWLVVADVQRTGLEAAVLARTAHTAVTAVVPHVRDPGAVVQAVTGALSSSGPGPAASVCVARVAGGEVGLSASCAPPPVLLTGGRVAPVDTAGPGTTVVRPPVDAVLVLHSDGLTRRAGRTVLLTDLLGAAPVADLDALADHLVRTADAAGPQSDDVSVLVARPADLRQV